MNNQPSFSLAKAILLWLMIGAIFIGFAQWYITRLPDNIIYPQKPTRIKPAYPATIEAYLSDIRLTSGSTALFEQSLLKQSAQNHANYLVDGHFPAENADPLSAHQESDIAHALFTGKTASERAIHVGWQSSMVGETIILTEIAQSPYHDTDSLLTAIYHRETMLEPFFDAVGAAQANGQGSATVFNFGKLEFHQQCQSPHPLKPRTNGVYIQSKCAHQKNQALIKDEKMPIVRFPADEFAEPAFSEESPDPLPDLSMSGNPISVMLDEKAQLQDFVLYDENNQKIQATRLLTPENDPNQALKAGHFALFPLQPLQFDSHYRARVSYLLDGKEKVEQWTFQTRQPYHDYFEVSGGEDLAVEKNQLYSIIFTPQCPNHLCAQGMKQSVWSTDGVEIVNIMPSEMIFRVMAGGKGKHSKISLPDGSGRWVRLYIVE